MEVRIEGHHFNISDPVRAYIEQEAAKLERFYTPLLECLVTLRKEGRLIKAGVVVHIHGQGLNSTHEADGVYLAVDGAMDKMVNQVKKLHDKRRRPRGGSTPVSEAEAGETKG